VFVILCSTLGAIFLIVGVRSHKELDRVVRIVLSLAIVFMVGTLAVKTETKNRQKKLSQREDSLQPEGLPFPLTHCAVPLNMLAAFLGDEVSWSPVLPNRVITIRGEHVLSIDRALDGGLLLSYEIFDDRGDIIARAEHNKFWVIETARMERPDNGTIRVFDHRDHKVLEVVFVNQNAVRVTGEFRNVNPPVITVVVSEKTITSTGNDISYGLCLGNTIGGFEFN
jgi:hypothetical protein